MSTKQYILIVFIVVFGSIALFFSGFFVKDLLKEPQNENLFKPTFVDEVLIINKEKPHQILKLSAFRIHKSVGLYKYILKAHYFDGTKWVDNIELGETVDLYNIPKSQTIQEWNIISDPSYMLKQSANGKILIDNYSIIFDIPNFINEIGIRSSPKYTKFMSETSGTMTVNNKIYDSNVLYSRTYSFNAPESLIYTSDPAGIETEWLAFWDSQGNFYTIDDTVVNNKKTEQSYKAHTMATEKEKGGKVQNSFDLKLNKITQNNYSVQIGDNINKIINVNKTNPINNAPNPKDFWVIGQVNGTVVFEDGKKLEGYGSYEQISQPVN